MKYLIGILLVLSLASCSDSGPTYRRHFENCMESLKNFDYTTRVEMCKVYAEKRMYEEFNENRR